MEEETPEGANLLLWWEGDQIRVATTEDRRSGEPLYIDPECEFWAEAAQHADEED